jgi:hypothetical protein
MPARKSRGKTGNLFCQSFILAPDSVSRAAQTEAYNSFSALMDRSSLTNVGYRFQLRSGKWTISDRTPFITELPSKAR